MQAIKIVNNPSKLKECWDNIVLKIQTPKLWARNGVLTKSWIIDSTNFISSFLWQYLSQKKNIHLLVSLEGWILEEYHGKIYFLYKNLDMIDKALGFESQSRRRRNDNTSETYPMSLVKIFKKWNIRHCFSCKKPIQIWQSWRSEC